MRQEAQTRHQLTWHSDTCFISRNNAKYVHNKNNFWLYVRSKAGHAPHFWPDLISWWHAEHAVSMPWSMTLQYHGHFRSKFFKVFKSLHEILEVNKCITYFRYLKNLLEPTSFKFWEKRRQNLRRFSQKIEEKKLFKIPKLNLTLVSVTLEFTELESLV